MPHNLHANDVQYYFNLLDFSNSLLMKLYSPLQFYEIASFSEKLEQQEAYK